MGINMDMRNELEYTFLDYGDLDEAERNKIRTILGSGTSSDILKLPWDNGEMDYDIPPTVMENPSEDETSQWQHYSMADGIPGYENCQVQSAPMMAPMTSGHHYPAHQMIAYVGDFTTMGNPYGNNGGGDPQGYSYPVTYIQPPAMFPSSTEMMGQQQAPRDNDNRRGRGRGGNSGKRKNYNRMINSSNDIQGSFVVPGQHQYSQMLPMCPGNIYSVPAPPQPAAGPPIFLQQPATAYHQAPQIHHNSHASYGHPQTSYQSHQHTTSNQKYMRGSTGQTTYYNQDSMKNSHKQYHDKRAHHHQQQQIETTNIPPFRHSTNNSNNNNNNNNNNNDGESPKRNFEKPLTVNNTSIDNKNNVLQTNAVRLEKKIIVQVKNETSDVPIVIDEPKVDKEIKVEKKESLVVVENDEDRSSNVYKEKISPREKEIPCVKEEKVLIAPKSAIEIAPRAIKILDSANDHVEPLCTVKKTHEPITKKFEKGPEVGSIVAPVATTNVPIVAAPSAMSWANVLRNEKRPSVDVRSPIPITKLPVARVPTVNFSTTGPNVDATINVKMPSNENVAKNESVVSNASRNSLEPVTTKNTDNSTGTEIKPTTETAQSNNLTDPAVFRMGELLLKYQMDKQTVSLLPRGLTNRSNYCYINSILQALLACPPFYNLLMALPHPRNTPKNSSTPLIDNMVRFVHEFTPLSEGARMPRKDRSQKRGEETSVDVQCGVAFEPSYVYTMLKNTSCAGVFSVEGRQEDAEEFLSCLLNGISDEMLELMKLVNSESSDATVKPTEANVNFSNAEEGWKVMGPKNKGSITRCTEFGRTPLSDIFRGQLRSRVSRTGDETTDNVQPFFTLQLDIEKAESVEDALDILVGKDQVEGMTCSKTKQQIEAWKQVLLEELPVILILHLKWFDYKLDGCSKIFKRVQFPIDLKLDGRLLSPNVAKKLTRKQRQYKLFAVTYHDGKEASKGHYVTDAFHVGYNAWVRYDDSSVKGIYDMDVLNPSPPRVPYLLYYRRCDTIGNNPPIATRVR